MTDFFDYSHVLWTPLIIHLRISKNEAFLVIVSIHLIISKKYDLYLQSHVTFILCNLDSLYSLFLDLKSRKLVGSCIPLKELQGV